MSGDQEEFDWGEAYARNSDPITSHIAAVGMEGENANESELKVIAAIKQMKDYGAISDDIVKLSGLDWNTATPRIAPLLRKGLITIRHDENFNIRTRMGRKRRPQQIYWIAKP